MKGIALGSEIILHISSTQEMSISRLRETAPVNSLDPLCKLFAAVFVKYHLFSPTTGEHYAYKSTYSQKLTLVLILISETV